MYFPFLRGKQYELIALRELDQVLSDNRRYVSPIIEPVRSSFSSINRTLENLRENNINFNIIVNPSVGELVDCTDQIINLITNTLSDYDNFQVGYYIDNDNSANNLLNIAQNININNNGISLIHISQIDNTEILDRLVDLTSVKYNIINIDRIRRYHRRFRSSNLVSLQNSFNTKSKNADYIEDPDELFSEEHLYYEEDDFIGFSDYLTIGEHYAETGFLPYAVVIHLTYTDNRNRIRIGHFVSDSIDDNTDIGGKFAEALDKMIDWTTDHEVQNTQGLNEFRALHKNGHFPGLGFIKKISIKHHIELVLNILSNNEQ